LTVLLELKYGAELFGTFADALTGHLVVCEKVRSGDIGG
jgi:hypothetical protein